VGFLARADRLDRWAEQHKILRSRERIAADNQIIRAWCDRNPQEAGVWFEVGHIAREARHLIWWLLGTFAALIVVGAFAPKVAGPVGLSAGWLSVAIVRQRARRKRLEEMRQDLQGIAA
jgi:Flp pilus assembly protein TadB